MELPQLDELELLHNRICRAVGDPRRIQILYALSAGPCYVTELAERVGAPQPTVSRHLSVLRQSGLVGTQRSGASVMYRISEPRIIEVLETMRDMLRDLLAQHSRLME